MAKPLTKDQEATVRLGQKRYCIQQPPLHSLAAMRRRQQKAYVWRYPDGTGLCGEQVILSMRPFDDQCELLCPTCGHVGWASTVTDADWKKLEREERARRQHLNHHH